jgi:hypothetical protein
MRGSDLRWLALHGIVWPSSAVFCFTAWELMERAAGLAPLLPVLRPMTSATVLLLAVQSLGACVAACTGAGLLLANRR